MKMSTATPASASRRETSVMYTFMPPASPVPGWSSGDVCTDRVATRCGSVVRRLDPDPYSESTRATMTPLERLANALLSPTPQRL
ncbi:hypothetical protein Val02_54960 [Virgisporangium aliadipatigenens]|uniref:Uncharacterized protein n=1 Tax=Virgisporangium aliadipatigenens TaxID=741659 RepID=A0A8J4DRY2_9ACTN|nr:hypothetical protein Val02_54960 [Virgisporangium aliadipatigenens]